MLQGLCENNDDDCHNIHTRDDLSSVKTSSNKEHLDYKSIQPPYHIKTSSEDSTTSPKSSGRDEFVQETKPKPKPKSVRRRRRKSPSDDKDSNKVKNNSSVDEQDDKQNLKMVASKDKSDEEEKEMDMLLEYYSRKKSPPWQKDEVDGSEEHKSPSEGTKEQATLQTSGHVHPNLPDYDEFIARFAALKEK